MIKVTNCAGCLGDSLCLTPLFKKEKGVVTMLLNPKTEKVLSKIYDGIADVEFVDNPVPACPETNEDVCYSQRILNHFNIRDVNAIPFVKVRPEELEWAKEFLKNYPNPIAFNPTVGSPTGHPLADYRVIPNQLAQRIVKSLDSLGLTVLHFGLSSNYQKFENTIPILDLTIRQLIACYFVIGRYVGADTGDYHLMLATGGLATVWVPPSIWHYNHKKHLYFSYAWKDEPPRVTYVLMDK